MDRKLLSVDDLMEIVAVAAEIKTEVADEMGDTAATMVESLAILHAIGASLETEIDHQP